MRVVLNIPKLPNQPYGEHIYMANVLKALIAVAPPDWQLTTHTVGLRGLPEHYSNLARIDPVKRMEQRRTVMPSTIFAPLVRNLCIPTAESVFGRHDIVHSFTGAEVLPAAKNFILTIHDLILFRMPEPNQTPEHVEKLRAILKWLVSHAVAVHTISQYSKGEIVNWLGVEPDRVVVIPNGVDHDLYRPLVESERHAADSVLNRFGIKKRYVLHMGGNAERKNVRRLLAAYQVLRTKYGVDYSLVVIGSKQTEPLAAAADKFPDDIHCLGYLDRSDAITILQSAELLVFPSLYEGFGLPPLEAMSCGVPTALARASSLPEVGGDAAVYFDPLDVEDMAQAMFNLLSDQKLRSVCTQRGLSRAADFSWIRLASSLVSLYSSVAEVGAVLPVAELV